MSFSLRKSFKIASGIRLNLSRKGLGLSVGVKGLRVGVGGGRKPRVTGGLGPVRFYQSLGGKSPLGYVQASISQSSGCIGTLLKGALVLACVSMLWMLIAPILRRRSDAALAPQPAVTAPARTAGATASSAPQPATPSPALAPVAPVPKPTVMPPASFADQVLDSQHQAMRKYPDLGKAGSPFNQLFLHEYDRQRLAASSRLRNPGWPLWLADECAARLQNPKLPRIAVDAPPDPGAIEAPAPVRASVDETPGPLTDPPAHGGTWVRGYTKKNGTSVSGYRRN